VIDPIVPSLRVPGRSASKWRRVVDLPAGRHVQEPYGKAVATRAGPELRRAGREGAGEALAGETRTTH